MSHPYGGWSLYLSFSWDSVIKHSSSSGTLNFKSNPKLGLLCLPCFLHVNLWNISTFDWLVCTISKVTNLTIFFYLFLNTWLVQEQCYRRKYSFPAVLNRWKPTQQESLLRERKRHTARRVVSTPVVLSGYPPAAGYPPSWPGQRGFPTWVPPAGYPLAGYPPSRVPPQLDLAGYPLPHGILGNVAKHYGIWVPPRCLPHGILGNVAKHYGIWVPPQVWTN